jgi:hypothetical protein
VDDVLPLVLEFPGEGLEPALPEVPPGDLQSQLLPLVPDPAEGIDGDIDRDDLARLQLLLLAV